MARYFAAMSSMSFQMNIDAGYTMMGQSPFQKQSGKALNAATKRIQEELPKMTTNMVNVYFYGKKYSVPADLTIMTAMEYAGYTLKRGCGCRHGFCGACATIYRIKGKNELKTCLACQTQVEEGMYVASIPFFPTDKRTYEIEDLKPDQQVMMELYPEIYSCIGCNACTKACTQNLNVMQYIAYAQRGELEKCAEESFDLSLIHI